MNISFRFFDKESWSIYGVHKTFLILMFFILLKVNLTPTILIFMSLLAMMEGQLFDKIIFTGFLNLLVYFVVHMSGYMKVYCLLYLL